MDNLGLGFLLMGVGMVTVFAILLIVIFGSRLIINIINRIAPEEVKAAVKAAGEDASTMEILSAAVSQLTGGKGKIVNVTKL